MTPQTRYAKAGDAYIAYQVTGDGALDVAFLPGFVSHVEHGWEEPGLARFFQRLGSFSRLIRLDKRGTGLSDRVSEIPTREQRTDDLRAVLDAAGSARPALFGVSEGGPVAMLFAATYPERTRALVLHGSYARRAWAPDSWPPSSWNGVVRPASRRGLPVRVTTNTSGSGGPSTCASPQAPVPP